MFMCTFLLTIKQIRV